MDYRHPIQQIANRYMAAYRDTYPNSTHIKALQYAVNAAITEIQSAGYDVYVDGTKDVVQSVVLKKTTTNGKEALNVQFFTA